MGKTRTPIEPVWRPPRQRAASTVRGSDAPVSTSRLRFSGPESGPAPSPLDHPAGRLLGPATVLGFQRAIGNAHVARLLIQRTDAVVGSAADKKRFEAIKKIMEASPTGLEALAVLNKHNVRIIFDTSLGTVYDPSTNVIVVDSNKPDATAALLLVHELNHARTHQEGLGADVMTLSREEYIKKKCEEEAEGTVKSIEAKIELEGTSFDVSQASFPLEKEYRTAYQQAIDDAKARNPETSEADLKRIGREAGKARVTKGFMDGEVIGNEHRRTYPDYFGRQWDRKHP